jgi:hypothetical protein
MAFDLWYISEEDDFFLLSAKLKITSQLRSVWEGEKSGGVK